MEITKIMTATMNDIIFDGRNKSYGAYELRLNYEKRAFKSLIISFLGILFLIVLYHFSIFWKGQNNGSTEKHTIVIASPPPEIFEQKKMEEIALPTKKTEALPPKPTIGYQPPNVLEDKLVNNEDTPPSQENMKAEISDKTTTQTSESANFLTDVSGENPPALILENTDNDDEISESVIVEQPAEFQGGATELMKWLSSEIRYPEDVRDIDGRVVLKFVVEKDGSISNIKTLKSTHQLFENEAIRAVKKMPNWKAGRQNGKAVRCYFTLPVSFKLS